VFYEPFNVFHEFITSSDVLVVIKQSSNMIEFGLSY